jgi:hypothetical protein
MFSSFLSMDPSNATLKNEWSYASTSPDAFMARTGTTLSSYFTVLRIKLLGYSASYWYYTAKIYLLKITN